MNKIFKIATLALAGTIAFAACKEEPVLRLTDVGPEMTVNSCTESTYMGADVKFSVDVNDSEFALSTLKAWLYYDETKVNELTIRTKENGTYEGAVQAPLYAKIPDGIATIVFAAQNVGMGLTYDTLYVSLKRPDFPTLTLKTEEGAEYILQNTDQYIYEVTDDFPAKVKGVLVTPAINDEGDVITIGWDGSALSASKDASIPYNAGLAGKYTIWADLEFLTTSPVGGKADLQNVASYTQGQVMNFGDLVDLNNWTLDYDFFNVNDDFTEVKFRAVDGLYKFNYDTENMWIKVEPMANDSELLSLSEDGSGAPWVIGSNFGKPVIGPGWNTEDGAYPMAQVAEKVYQFTLSAPGQVAVSGADFKFFHQKGWGGEFVKADYAEVNIAPAFDMTDSGNIQGKEVKGGKSYKFTLDLTGGVKAAKLSCEEVVVPVNMLDIQVNGVDAMKMSNEVYKVMAVNVEQNSIISFSGIDSPENWWVDPDHFEITAEGLKFKAVSGYYSFELNLANQFVTVRRVKADGKAATYADEGAITFMGWGVAHPVMTSQLAWDSGALITLAEIEKGVYQFTGIAVEESDGETIGGRWRYDYLSFKFFGQAGWGDEQGTVTLTPEAAKCLATPGNVELAEGVTLELGATYVMTVTAGDLKDGKFDVTIDFVKK